LERYVSPVTDRGDGAPQQVLNGWIANASPSGGGTLFHVVGEPGGRRRIVGVYVYGPEITASDLQEVPVRNLDLYLNLGRGVSPHSSLQTLDEIATLRHRGPMVYEPAAPGETIEQLEARVAQAADAMPQPAVSTRKRLTRPDGTDPDAFYRQVAQAYREYAPETRAPAVAIAKEAGVPAGTAQGWVREARRRGFLPPGRKGKAG
jgi:hypothetical protein